MFYWAITMYIIVLAVLHLDRSRFYYLACWAGWSYLLLTSPLSPASVRGGVLVVWAIYAANTNLRKFLEAR